MTIFVSSCVMSSCRIAPTYEICVHIVFEIEVQFWWLASQWLFYICAHLCLWELFWKQISWTVHCGAQRMAEVHEFLRLWMYECRYSDRKWWVIEYLIIKCMKGMETFCFWKKNVSWACLLCKIILVKLMCRCVKNVLTWLHGTLLERDIFQMFFRLLLVHVIIVKSTI